MKKFIYGTKVIECSRVCTYVHITPRSHLETQNLILTIEILELVRTHKTV